MLNCSYILHYLLLMKYLSGLLCVLLFISCEGKNASFSMPGEQEPSYNLLSRKDQANHVMIPSKVDWLNTNDEVEQFIHEADTNFRNFYLRPLKDLDMYGDKDDGDSIFSSLVDKYKIDKNFYKTDIDNNGYTDMLVMGRWEYPLHGYANKKHISDSYIIMNYGHKLVKFLRVSRQSSLPVLRKMNGKIFLDLHRPVKDYDYSGSGVKVARDSVTVLQWASIGFAEYNPAPKDYKIEIIQFKSGPCFGSCPVYEFTIRNDGSALFYADQHNFPNEYYTCRENTVYSSSISHNDLSSMIYFLNYLDFPTLEQRYSTSGSDMATVVLSITYDNGKVKTIGDYGCSGTYGLRTLYTFMQELRFNQNWKEITNPKEVRMKGY